MVMVPVFTRLLCYNFKYHGSLWTMGVMVCACSVVSDSLRLHGLYSLPGLPGFSVHVIFQAGGLEGVAIPFSRGVMVHGTNWRWTRRIFYIFHCFHCYLIKLSVGWEVAPLIEDSLRAQIVFMEVLPSSLLSQGREPWRTSVRWFTGECEGMIYSI